MHQVYINSTSEKRYNTCETTSQNWKEGRKKREKEEIKRLIFMWDSDVIVLHIARLCELNIDLSSPVLKIGYLRKVDIAM